MRDDMVNESVDEGVLTLLYPETVECYPMGGARK